MERLFFGVPVTAAARNEVQAALAGRDLPGRPVPPENWHLTLRFLGDTAPDARDRLIAQLEDAGLGGAFSLEFGGFGAFPRPERARVVWLGVKQGAERLAELSGVAEQAARTAGFPPERKPFRSHLTLARMEPPRSVARILGGDPVQPVAMRVNEVILFRSELGRTAVRYEILNRFPLEENTK